MSKPQDEMYFPTELADSESAAERVVGSRGEKTCESERGGYIYVQMQKQNFRPNEWQLLGIDVEPMPIEARIAAGNDRTTRRIGAGCALEPNDLREIASALYTWGAAPHCRLGGAMVGCRAVVRESESGPTQTPPHKRIWTRGAPQAQACPHECARMGSSGAGGLRIH